MEERAEELHLQAAPCDQLPQAEEKLLLGLLPGHQAWTLLIFLLVFSDVTQFIGLFFLISASIY